jgi:phage replication-related protein YjqB (UPF0714/DUF867 family)
MITRAVAELTRRAFLAGGTAVSFGSLPLLSDAGRQVVPTNGAVDGPLTVRPADDLSTTTPASVGLLASRELVSQWRLTPGQQIRLRRNADEFAVFTLETIEDAKSNETIWLSDAGLSRLGTQDIFDTTVSSPVPDAKLTSSAAAREGEYVEELRDQGAHWLVVTAPHGGKIEPYTDRQASRVADRLPESSTWIGRGWRPGGGAYERWHVTSTDIAPTSYPKLGTIADRGFEYAVSFHGFSGDGISIGGGASNELKHDVLTAIEDAVEDVLDVRLATDGPYAGQDPNNIFNWLTANGRNGIQV